MHPESLTAQIYLLTFPVFSLHNQPFCASSSSKQLPLPSLGVVPCCKEKFTCLTCYTKKKGVWEEVPGQPTQACWDHWALTSASSSKIYSDLHVFSSFLSMKEKIDSWGVRVAIADLFIIFTLLSYGIHKIFCVNWRRYQLQMPQQMSCIT